MIPAPQPKPELSFLYIWNMCFGFLGIQFGFALQNANVSRIFQTLGASVDQIPILWIAAPLTGLLVQPIVGYYSDRTWNRLGRRRPYFFAGAVLTTLALVLMPNSPGLWIAAGMLWIMDASINISMEPFRAFVGDMLPNRQRTLGFAMQGFFIGVGAVIASALPWIMSNWFDVSNVASPGEVPASVKWAFYIGGAVLFLAVMWTVISTREYSPEQLTRFSEQEKSISTQLAETEMSEITLGGIFKWLLSGIVLLAIIFYQELDQQLYILAVGLLAFALLQFYVVQIKKRPGGSSAVMEIMDDFRHMPRTMKQLAVVQFFSWFALFAMWIYTTAAVTEFHYGSSDTSSLAYNNGADWVGVLFASYNGFAALAAFLIPLLARVTNRKVTHLICLWCGGLGLISFVFIRDPVWLLLPMVGVGIAWASILSVPYAILSSALPAKKMGVYMGIFNFFIVIPQILAATVIGLIVGVLFDGQAIYALVLGGVLLIVAGIATLSIDDV